ncbi:MAG: hypothetical protein QOE92_680, partial [Chloroflexota bacterium]|nr:hypothetical protein [Chloroflexota bacterium]
VVHSLVTFRANLPVGAGSIWHLARGTGWEALAQRADMAVVILVVIAVNAWLVTRPGGLTGARLYAALALTAAAFALLAKTVWPYYLFEVYVFTVVWSAGRRPARRLALVAPPAAVAALGLWAEVGVTPGFADGLVRAHDVVSFAALGAGIVAVAWTAGAPQWAPADRG